MTGPAPVLGHAAALDLAAAAPAFPLTGEESRDLAAHLRACADCARRAARLRTDLASIGAVDPALSPRLHDRLREVAVTAPRSGPSALGVVLVLALLAVGIVGASIGVGALAARPAADTPAANGKLPAIQTAPGDVLWAADNIQLAARGITIDADGLTFTGAATARINRDPGDATRWTLEAEWTEHGRPMRLYLYFAANDRAWWISEARAYDGSPRGDWAFLAQGQTPVDSFALAPIGTVYEGDWTFTDIPSATGPVTVTMPGVRLAAAPIDTVTEPVGVPAKALVENGNPAVNGDPFEVGGPLRCSGILQLPPQAAEIRLLALGYSLSWRWMTKTGSNTGFSEPRDRAPDRGWITDTAVGGTGELIVFVANPDSPFGAPLARPSDCPAP